MDRAQTTLIVLLSLVAMGPMPTIASSNGQRDAHRSDRSEPEVGIAHGVSQFNASITEAPTFSLTKTETHRRVLHLDDSVKGFQGRIVYPVPPSDPCQRVFSCRMVIVTNSGTYLAKLVRDQSSMRKPVLVFDVPDPSDLEVHVEVDVQFFDTKLEAGLPQKPNVPLTVIERTSYLDNGFKNAEQRNWFDEFIRKNGLVRGSKEDDLTFASRVLKFVSTSFQYEIPERPALKELNAQYGDFGTLLYTILYHSGECWKLSSLYAYILRESRMPVRQVSGNWVNGKGGHHLRDLVWTEALGWVPVDPSNATQIPSARGTQRYMGSWGGDFLSGNESVGINLPFGCRPDWNLTWTTFDTLMYLSNDGVAKLTNAIMH